MSDLDAIVVGAGVIGLTSAIRLAEAGLRTAVWTADEAAATTSYAAGASWGPHLVADQPEVTTWSRRTLAIHRDLAMEDGTGVRIGTGVEASRGTITAPVWASDLDDVRVVGPDHLPAGFTSGWRHRTPLIDMPVHLAYLRRRYLDGGGSMVSKRIDALSEVAAPIVVNCTGIGARDLVGDTDLTPIRGQVVICENPGITEFFVEDPGPVPDLTYYFPHGDAMVLGGQALPGDFRREPDPQATHDIVARCAAIDPRLAAARILDVRVGLRPRRSRVRLESTTAAAARVIHNYGHGGSGVTLSWGCADDVVTLATA
ncbi:MAG TPA: FAD-dependent oxidoreductase [Micromonosporaceae bacterium]